MLVAPSCPVSAKAEKKARHGSKKNQQSFKIKTEIKLQYN